MEKPDQGAGKFRTLIPKSGLPIATEYVYARSDFVGESNGGQLYIGLLQVQETDYFRKLADPSMSGAKGLYLAPGFNNRLIVSYGKSRAPAFVFGGVAKSGADDVFGNEIHFSGGDAPSGVLVGGFSHYGGAGGNTVFFRGGALAGTTFQAYKYAIVGGGALGGGKAANPNVVRNRVFVFGEGDIAGRVVGGMAFGGNSSGAKGNRVNISGGGVTITGGVIGGIANGGDAVGNSVEYKGGDIVGEIMGGNVYDGSGHAQDNGVLIDGAGVIDGTVYGGLTSDSFEAVGDAKNNAVTVKNSYRGNIYSIVGGESYNGDATGNTVSIAGVYESGDYQTNINYISFGGSTNYNGGSASGNRVFLDTVKINNVIYGGIAHYYVSGGASDNTITVKNSCVASGLVGGYSYGTGCVNRNRITIDGCKMQRSVVVGAMAHGTSAAHDDNAVTLTGDITLENFNYLQGFRGWFAGAGNTLNLHRLNCVGKWTLVENFQKYNFKIDAGKAAAAGDAVTDFALVANTVEMGEAVVESIEITGGSLKEGDQVGLIKAETSFASGIYGAAAQPVQAAQGASAFYDFAVTLKNNQLVATVKGIRANRETNAPAKLLSQPADFHASARSRENVTATGGAA